MTFRRGIFRAEQKRRRGRPVETNDRLTTFRRAKSFAALDEVAISPRLRDLTPTYCSIR
jgi:hypothetical protein